MKYPKTRKKASKKQERPAGALLIVAPVNKHDPKDREPDPVGRPSLYTGLDCPYAQMILTCLMKDYTVAEACAKAMISTQTFYTWVKKHYEFAESVQIACQIPGTKAKDNVIADIEAKSVPTSIWYLEHRQRDRYAKRSENMTNAFEPLTNEEQKELDEALKNAGLK